MEVLGFIFGLVALAVAGKATQDIRTLREELEALKRGSSSRRGE